MGNKFPVFRELEAGTYQWCSCGKTKTEPFCDGSHGEADKGPVEFKLKEKTKTSLCTCGQTQNAPFCDGTHVRIP
ncbi:MAG: CDGSH iron-sulfur domain-containing protein [Desulfobacterales bacterium]|nr:CDGSH iron-sulfur domain-containing protein [Desulfobacterales bacterium]